MDKEDRLSKSLFGEETFLVPDLKEVQNQLFLPFSFMPTVRKEELSSFGLAKYPAL